MKNFFLVLALTLSAQAFGQQPTTQDVCEKIQRSNADAAKICALFVGHDFSQPALDVAYVIVDLNPYTSLEILSVSAGRKIDREASRVCLQIIQLNQRKANPCFKTIADKFLYSDEAKVCEDTLQLRGVSAAIQCLKERVIEYQ